MQRSPHLQPLSHDHYEGLVVVRRLRAGLDRQADPGVMAAYVAHAWEHTLAPHFEREETLLAPVLEAAGGQALAARMRTEHRQLRSLVTAAPTAGDRAGTLAAFAQTLQAHIRFEERELFPFVEERTDEAVLRRLGAQLHDAPAEDGPAWAAAFWE